MRTTPRPPMPRRTRALLAAGGLTALLTAGALLALGHLRAVRAAAAPAPAALASTDAAATPAGPAAPGAPAAAPAPRPMRLSVLTIRLGRNQTLSQALGRLRLAPAQANAVLHALADKLHFRKVKPGDQLRIERVEGQEELHRLTYRQGPADEWVVTPDPAGELKGEKRSVELTREVARVEIEVHGSLWESLQRAGEDPQLAVLASDVLAWDVDFYQDVRAGDRLKVVVEKVFADGKLLKYGEVLAAEYDGDVTGPKRLFRYTDAGGFTSYYDDQGQSARRGFLKSPLPYAHLTSGFGSRVHPVLGYVKSHQGVDYGAPTGTPVWAVGDGTVAQAGVSGGCGKSVILRHRNGFDTQYCHLSAISVHAGERVGQKQLIGLVGQTGLATGPHLHYAVKRGGQYVNPLSLKVPREAPINPSEKARFQEAVAPLRAQLDASPTV